MAAGLGWNSYAGLGNLLANSDTNWHLREEDIAYCRRFANEQQGRAVQYVKSVSILRTHCMGSHNCESVWCPRLRLRAADATVVNLSGESRPLPTFT